MTIREPTHTEITALRAAIEAELGPLPPRVNVNDYVQSPIDPPAGPERTAALQRLRDADTTAHVMRDEAVRRILMNAAGMLEVIDPVASDVIFAQREVIGRVVRGGRGLDPPNPFWKRCENCGGPAGFWQTSDQAWQRIHDDTGYAVVCLPCALVIVESITPGVFWFVQPTVLADAGVDAENFLLTRRLFWPER